MNNITSHFSNLWETYIKLAPQANDILKLFQNTQKKPIINDHIALRTISSDICNISKVAHHFLALGYEKKETFHFKDKHLDAIYLDHNLNVPKVFISELLLNNFTKEIQNILLNAINNIPKDVIESNKLSFSGRHWDINYKDYKKLYKQSEYAAWFYAYGFTANHFTIYINDLENFSTIEDVSIFLKSNGYKLNSSGGEIKGSQEELLEQSSTLAQIIEVEFTDGIFKIPSCFYEFAIRYKDTNGILYPSFIPESANKIFESTN